MNQTETLKGDLSDVAGTMWGAHSAVANSGSGPAHANGDPERRLKALEDERAVRNVLNRYVYSYDSADIDGLMEVFHPRCQLVNPRGTYIGTKAIRDNYLFLMAARRIRFHITSNVAAYVLPDGDTAWLTCYLYSVGQYNTGALTITTGTYVDKLVRDNNNGWQILECRITANITTDFPQPVAKAPTSQPPPGASTETSHDWIGAEWIQAVAN